MSLQDEQGPEERSEGEPREDEQTDPQQTGPEPGDVANLPPPPLVPVGPPPHEAPDEDRATEGSDRDEPAI